MIRRWFIKLFGLCDHHWTTWGKRTPEKYTRREGGMAVFHAVQTRRCTVCGKSEQRDVGLATVDDLDGYTIGNIKNQ